MIAALAASGSPSTSTPTEEDAEIYTMQLRERTRDSDTYPLVISELAGYGFRRNLLGLRPLGLVASGAAFLAAVYAFGWSLSVGHEDLVRTAGLSAALDAISIVLWARTSGQWVRSQAFAYARALLNAAEIVYASGPPSSG
jgi:hypothetical protein